MKGERRSSAMDPTERTLTGATIAGRYQILGPLGRGGIGQVYAAEQIGLDRQVAVKVIRKGRRGDMITEKRFMREARAAGRISSPHVVTLFDFGRDPGSGLLYLAMELLEGESLSDRLDDPTLLEMHELLKVGAAIARGLRAAHEAGVLHRDLKPANVFLCEDDTVKVLDFGIAKLMDDGGDWEPLTQVNRILGTPVYMSPEAAPRRPRPPHDDRSLAAQEHRTQVPRLRAQEPLARIGRRHAAGPRRRIPPMQEDLGDLREARSAGEHPQPEVVVFGPARIEVPAGRLERLAAEDDRRVRDRTLHEDLARDLLVRRQAVQPALVP